MCRSPTPIVILTEVDVEYCFFTPQCLLTLFVQDTRGTHDLAVHADGAYGELRGVLNILISTGMYFRFIQFKVHVIICCSTAEYYIRIFVHTPLYTVLQRFPFDCFHFSGTEPRALKTAFIPVVTSHVSHASAILRCNYK